MLRSTEEPAEADDGGADATMEPTEEILETPPPQCNIGASGNDPGRFGTRQRRSPCDLVAASATEFLALPAPTTGGRRRAAPVRDVDTSTMLVR